MKQPLIDVPATDNDVHEDRQSGFVYLGQLAAASVDPLNSSTAATDILRSLPTLKAGSSSRVIILRTWFAEHCQRSTRDSGVYGITLGGLRALALSCRSSSARALVAISRTWRSAERSTSAESSANVVTHHCQPRQTPPCPR